jgi:hypothetical protein
MCSGVCLGPAEHFPIKWGQTYIVSVIYPNLSEPFGVLEVNNIISEKKVYLLEWGGVIPRVAT